MIEFFYREFNDADPTTGITPLRPIAAPNDNATVVAPADCTYKKDYKIDSKGNVFEKDSFSERFADMLNRKVIQYDVFSCLNTKRSSFAKLKQKDDNEQ